MIVRELTGGVYFGEPKQIVDLGNGQKRAIDTQVYDTYEIERIARVAFELARRRGNKVTSSEKHNVMKSGVLWREVVTALHAREYPDVKLDHMLADALGMQLVRRPKQFDVIVTDNLFGDMLSDVAAMLTGSLGMLPSASLGDSDRSGKRKALYEPVHGSAPDIAGKGLANPIAMIGSFGMALRYSFGLPRRRRPARGGDRRGSGGGPAHGRHRGRRRAGRLDPGDGRCDRNLAGEGIRKRQLEPFAINPRRERSEAREPPRGIRIASSLRRRKTPQHEQKSLLRNVLFSLGFPVRQVSWRDPAGGRPVRVSRSGRPVASVAWPSATAVAKRTQRSCGVCIEPRKPK